MVMKNQKKPEKKSIAKKSSREECPHCVSGPETYGYLKRGWVYDVDLARKIVSDGRDPVELEADDVEYCVDNSRIYEQHLDHVDPQYPGILAHLWGPGENGAWEHGHLLIDGNHRAARCLRDGIPFRAYLLTEDESEAILLRGTDRSGNARG
ncbi:MAG: hypothetical protein JNM43_17745 [Planctomycetaceae bacterium]|nr:hypothetical protein [Planctomycetaceae bacterium]